MLPARQVLRHLELSPQALACLLDASFSHTRDAAVLEHRKHPQDTVCGQRCSDIHTSTSMGGPAWQAFHALDTQSQPSTSGAMPGHPGYGHSRLPDRTRGLKTSQADDDDLTALSELLQGDQRAMLTPAAIVEALDRYIVGQADAKRAVAVAMRNRWRRSRLPRLAADEVMPKNILMVGPTGVGKTEIARRLAKLADAPFIKVEATKYTELGYVGRDVEDIIKDLVEASQALVRQRLQQHAAAVTNEKVENVILNALCGEHSTSSQRDTFRDLYRQGMLDERVVDVDLPSGDANTNRVSFEGGVIIMDHVAKANKAFGGSKRPGDKQKFKVSEARAALEDAEADKLMSSEQVTHEAIRSAEQDGIVFIDEIDKIVEASGGSRMSGGGSVSSDGVQRDLLPIVEGSIVPTKYGNVDTSHILFICSGAFHSAKPSDMLAELQGRLPIRVSLQGLTAHDFFRILTEPENNMIKQQKALLATEDVDLRFSDGAIKAIAQVAEEVNRVLDNIGARRLHTVIERIIADISYSAPELAAEAKRNGQPQLVYHIDEAYVQQVMQPLLAKKDLTRYVL